MTKEQKKKIQCFSKQVNDVELDSDEVEETRPIDIFMDYQHTSPLIVELLDRANYCVDKSMIQNNEESNCFDLFQDVEYVTKICIAMKFLVHNKQNLLLIEEFKGPGSLMICLLHFQSKTQKYEAKTFGKVDFDP